MYILIANLIVAVHMIFVVFMFFGFIWTLASGRVANTIWGEIFFIAFLLTALQQIVFKGCILTQLEQKLRKRVDPKLNYRSTFLAQYFPFLVGIKLSQRTVTVMHLTITAFIGLYLVLIRR